MEIGPYKKAENIWTKKQSKSKPAALKFEVEFYKKMLNVFHVGDYYYGIFSYNTKDFEFISKDVESVLGYSAKEMTVPFLVDKIHPGDINHFLNFENRAMDFLITLTPANLMKYKIRHDYRIRKSNGDYRRILQQGIVIEHDEEGGILRTLIVHTDITHLKPDGKPVLSFIGIDGEPSYINVEAEKVFSVSKEFLSKREKQILTLLIEGKLSKEIAETLNISKQTVDKHRKNMLYRNQLNTVGELIGKAIRQGWF